MSDNLVPVTIDGHEVKVPRGTLVVEAAREIGIEIPVYCYHPKLKPVGACRVCAVEVEGQRRPIMTACTTEVTPNMVVHTRSENAIAAREGILEFLLINHPLDCPVCDRGGECDLQDFTLRYGPGTTRFIEAKRHFTKSKRIGREVILDRERCIMCQRCVRFCDEIAMEEGLVIIDRGYRSEIGTFEGRSYDSQYSGNTVELCPVGALTSATYRFSSRPWEQQHFAGICNHCSVGCNITMDVRYDEVVRFRSRCNDEIDDGWLCDTGRYGHAHIHADKRLLSPMLRNGSGALEPVSWERALAAAADGLKGDQAQATVLLGSQLSLEDGHAWLRLARGLLKTGNIDHYSGNESAWRPGVAADEQGATGRVMGCDDAEVIVCLGSHPYGSHPAVDLRIKKGIRRGARLVSLNSEPVLEGFADFQALGTPGQLWERLLQAIDSLPEPTATGLRVPAPRPWEAGGATSNSWSALTGAFRNRTRVMVIVAGDLSAQGLDGIAKAVGSRGWATAPHGLLHLRSGANAVGLDQIGCRPGSAPGGEPLGDGAGYSSSWGDFSNVVGRSFAENVKGGGGTMLAVGCDPLAGAGAGKAAFLIACATSANSTTEQADVVLPLSTWVESHGSFVSTDGSVQLSRQAVLPIGQSQPAWAIASALVKAIRGGEAPYKSTRQIFAEIGQLNPAFMGRSYRDFEAPGEMHWSYPHQAIMGMPRPDLSAIPVSQPDMPMWMPVVDTGSTVENAARMTRGESVPMVTGQGDPRLIAARLGLAEGYVRHPEELKSPSAPARPGFVPLRVMPSSSAQPAGPTPAKRHQRLGMGPHVPVALPLPAKVALPEAPAEAAAAPAASEIITPSAVSSPDTTESTAKKVSEESRGEPNVATVNVVTEDKAAQERAAESPASATPMDGVHTSDTGEVVEPEGTSHSEGERPGQAISAKSLGSLEENAPQSTPVDGTENTVIEGEARVPVTADPDVETGNVASEADADAPTVPEPGTPPSMGKAKKGKRKGAKEKKSP